MALYLDYDRPGLDAQYNNRALVPDFAAYLDRFDRDSAAVRARLACELDVAYGPAPRHRLDIFPAPGDAAPVHVFIHGGYWRAMDKSGFSYPAAAFVEAGITYVAISYPLAPAATMDEIVASVRGALAWVARRASGFGGDATRITVSGHSAGGHLAAILLATDWSAFDDGGGALPPEPVKAGCAISGLYDLEPIRLCYLNEDLRLDPDMARRNSPVHDVPARAGPLILAVGRLESDEYQRQQATFAAAWRRKGLAVTEMDLPGEHHFSIVEQLADPTSALFRAVESQVPGPG